MMVKVKICGVTSATDAIMAAQAGADAVGFNFYPPSPRYLDPEDVLPIRLNLPPFVAAVGVFVDAPATRVAEVMERCRLDYAQLHGRESPRTVERLKDYRVIKAVRVAGEADLKDLARYDVEAFLLDAKVKGRPGGTGQTLDWELARAAASRARIVLAGGLRPENVAQAVWEARPYAVDVASGVEQEPGVKSRELVSRFIRAAKGVDL